MRALQENLLWCWVEKKEKSLGSYKQQLAIMQICKLNLNSLEVFNKFTIQIDRDIEVGDAGGKRGDV